MSLDIWGTITEEEISRRLGLLPFEDPSKDDDFRCAAVLIPLIKLNDGWHLLFTRRTDTVNSHKGQVSFPGGTCELGDNTPEQTALREAYEEIGLIPEDVIVFGRLNRLPTVSHYIVTPVLGRIPWPYQFHLSLAEVSRIFTIPLIWLSDPNNRETRTRVLPSGKLEDVVYFRPYDGETLWGISAQITLRLLDLLR